MLGFQTRAKHVCDISKGSNKGSQGIIEDAQLSVLRLDFTFIPHLGSWVFGFGVYLKVVVKIMRVKKCVRG